MSDPLKHLVEYTIEDNRLSDDIYRFLLGKLKKEDFTLNESLLAPFFFDCLKYLTGTFFRYREVQHQLDPKELQQPLKLWPYTGYYELRNQLSEISELSFEAPLRFNKPHILKRALASASRLTSKLPFFGKRQSIGFLDSSIDKEIAIKSILRGYEIQWSNTGWLDFSFPHLQNQKNQLRSTLTEFIQTFGLEIDQDRFADIYLERVNSIFELKREHSKNPDFFLTCSGVELKMRLCTRNKPLSKVIAVMHGDSFGIMDDPCVGVGEFLFSDAQLGYGEQFLSEAKSFRYIEDIPYEYLPGDSELIAPLFKNPPIKKSKLENKSIFYVPTSYRGNRHRYGPSQDLPDLLYQKVETFLLEHFGENLRVKTHPKDHYRKNYGFYHERTVTEPLMEVLNQPDVFIFDYLSSAFTLACTTNKPIIFFDLSIQYIPDSVISTIKKRCVYIKVSSSEDIDFQEIEERLNSEDKSHDYTQKFSLTNNRQSRSSALYGYLKKSSN